MDATGHLSADGARAYVFADADDTDDFNELMIYNTSAPDAIQLEGQISSIDGLQALRVQAMLLSQDGRIVYVVDEEGLKLWSIQNIATPVRLGEYKPGEKLFPRLYQQLCSVNQGTMYF